jgi:hypothetical protein
MFEVKSSSDWDAARYTVVRKLLDSVSDITMGTKSAIDILEILHFCRKVASGSL